MPHSGVVCPLAGAGQRSQGRLCRHRRWCGTAAGNIDNFSHRCSKWSSLYLSGRTCHLRPCEAGEGACGRVGKLLLPLRLKVRGLETYGEASYFYKLKFHKITPCSIAKDVRLHCKVIFLYLIPFCSYPQRSKFYRLQWPCRVWSS